MTNQDHEALVLITFYAVILLRFVSAKVANGKRFAELDFLGRIVKYNDKIKCQNMFAEWLEKYRNSNAIKVLRSEFVTSEINKKKYQNCVFIESDHGEYQISKVVAEAFEEKQFREEMTELVQYGIRRNALYYSETYKNTDFVLYQKYTYEDVCKLLNWEQNVVAQNIGGYKYDEGTNTFPVFINYNKEEGISDTIRYEDRFIDESMMIALSKQSRTIESKDVKQIYGAKENGTKIYLFVRKNKDDATSKEFYFLGEVEAIGTPRQVVMKNTDKKAVEITYKLDVPVREDVYEYIIS